MKITVIGTGYVGLVTGTVFAELGNEVMCVDIDQQKITNLQKNQLPIYEPGLEELVKRNQEQKRLMFATDLAKGIKFAKVVFSAVGTPPDQSWKADLSAVKKVAAGFGQYLNGFKLFVNKSTVPVGTAAICQQIIQKELQKRRKKIEFKVVSNPEFLREGAAVKDSMNPERIIIGTNSGRAKEILERLYFPLVRSKSPLIFMSRRSAEISKYAANAFLATKISFINEIASFCEAAGGDVREIARGIGLDSRIGSRFLHAGIGYGGSCFPKDVQALIQSGKEYNADLEILKATEVVNSRQKKKIFNWLLAKLPQLENKQIAVWGLSFKPRTDDMRDAPSIKVIKKLQGEGAKVRVFDPVAMENAQKIFSKVNLTYAQSPLAAAKKADALIILTEWDVFRSVDPEDLAKAMKGKLILDGRNILNEQEMQRYGFQVLGIGRQQND